VLLLTACAGAAGAAWLRPACAGALLAGAVLLLFPTFAAAVLAGTALIPGTLFAGTA
jgi:hypothetical protein